MEGYVEVPGHLKNKAAGRIFRNELHYPIGGFDERGRLLVLDDWRWRRFLDAQTAG